MIHLNEVESNWVDEQIAILKDIEGNPSKYNDEEIKERFDYFYKTVCSWRNKYDTKHLATFWAIGVDYDGYRPGNTPNFIGLYKELMEYVKDKVMDKPISYAAEKDGKWYQFEEDEDGNKKIIKEI